LSAPLRCFKFASLRVLTHTGHVSVIKDTSCELPLLVRAFVCVFLSFVRALWMHASKEIGTHIYTRTSVHRHTHTHTHTFCVSTRSRPHLDAHIAKDRNGILTRPHCRPRHHSPPYPLPLDLAPGVAEREQGAGAPGPVATCRGSGCARQWVRADAGRQARRARYERTRGVANAHAYLFLRRARRGLPWQRRLGHHRLHLLCRGAAGRVRPGAK